MVSLLSRGAISIPCNACRPLHLLRFSGITTNTTGASSRAMATSRATCPVVSSAQALLAAAVVFTSSLSLDSRYDVPQTLSGDDRKQTRIQRPKSRQAERCVGKCVTTCILGGAGSPGEGPLNVRRPLVVFKGGFRSRQYCLLECSDICNLIKDGEDGP